MSPAEPFEEPAPPALRRYFARHNRQAVLLAFFSLLTAAALWGLIYLFTFWFALVAATLSKSFNPETLLEINQPQLLGPHFPLRFAAVAVAALVVAALAQQWVRPEKLREGRHYLLWVLTELFFAVPNVTFAVWGNLSAIIRLRRREIAKAWQLLRRMNEEGGRLSMTRLRTEIEDEETLDRVLIALQLSGLVGLRENREGWFLFLANKEALALLLEQG